MKTVLDLDNNEIQVPHDTMCKAGRNGGLPQIYSDAELAIIQDEQAGRDALALTEKLKALPTQLRKVVEDGPHTVNGIDIIMDLKTELRLNSTIKAMQEFNLDTQGWKAENGYFTLSLQDFLTITSTVHSIISKAFAAEGITQREITDGTLTTLEEVTTRFNNLME